jgi:hypothetical protein
MTEIHIPMGRFCEGLRVCSAVATHCSPSNAVAKHMAGFEQSYPPLDPLGIICRPPLDSSAGVWLVKRSRERSLCSQNFHPPYLTGRAVKGTWGNLKGGGGGKSKKEMTSIKGIASDESEMVPNTHVRIIPLLDKYLLVRHRTNF